jgi:HEAT repeat protein
LKAANLREADDDNLTAQYWEPVRVLHCRADDEVMTRAAELLASVEAEERCLGANVLSQVYIGDEARAAEAGKLLACAVQSEHNEAVLNDLIFALGHTPTVEACGRLQELARHSSADLRYAVAWALPHDEYITLEPTMMDLMKDVDSDVRDWATFGLGSLMDTDSPKVREALRARLSDSDADTQGEAMVGLAKRGDMAAVPVLLREMARLEGARLRQRSYEEEAAELCLEAAEKVPSEKWALFLTDLRRFENFATARIDEAIERCRSKIGNV